MSVSFGALGVGAQGAEGDLKPQMFNEGFGAQGAKDDLKPQMLNWGLGRKAPKAT